MYMYYVCTTYNTLHMWGPRAMCMLGPFGGRTRVSILSAKLVAGRWSGDKHCTNVFL